MREGAVMPPRYDSACVMRMRARCAMLLMRYFDAMRIYEAALLRAMLPRATFRCCYLFAHIFRCR